VEIGCSGKINFSLHYSILLERLLTEVYTSMHILRSPSLKCSNLLRENAYAMHGLEDIYKVCSRSRINRAGRREHGDNVSCNRKLICCGEIREHALDCLPSRVGRGKCVVCRPQREEED
jgi:hypothetical protein